MVWIGGRCLWQLFGSLGVIHLLCSIVVQIGRTGLRGKTDVVLLEGRLVPAGRG